MKMVYLTKEITFKGEKMIAFYIIGNEDTKIKDVTISYLIPIEKLTAIEFKRKELQRYGYTEVAEYTMVADNGNKKQHKSIVCSYDTIINNCYDIANYYNCEVTAYDMNNNVIYEI
jgi:hypothetical protein